jgi:hypothetical protein
VLTKQSKNRSMKVTEELEKKKKMKMRKVGKSRKSLMNEKNKHI